MNVGFFKKDKLPETYEKKNIKTFRLKAILFPVWGIKKQGTTDSDIELIRGIQYQNSTFITIKVLKICFCKVSL